MAQAASLIGQSIGNYRVTAGIGQGGMGQVYKAVHQHLRRPAAIKVLNPDLSARQESVQRFFNEAMAANVVQHPSLVGVYEAGYLPSGCAYLIMEYLEGETLGKYLSRVQRMPDLQALLVVHQVAAALVPLHAQGIIHRDLKLDNVMLISDLDLVGGKRVKILDFGLAKVAARHQLAAVETRSGAALGTPPYMAPEQWIAANKVDGKADVYSLGVMLYRMLTGGYPFSAESVKGYQEQHLYSEIPHPAQANSTIAARVNDITRSMLTKGRGQRPSMAEVLASVAQELARRAEFPAVAGIDLDGSDASGTPATIGPDSTKDRGATCQPTRQSDGLSMQEPTEEGAVGK